MRKSYVSQNVTVSIVLIALIIGTIYLLFIFSSAIWKSQRKEKLYEEFRKDIARLEEENASLSERYDLQRTDEFFDKYAKSNLGKINPGEKVIIIENTPETPPLDFSGLSDEEKEMEILKARPIREQWWHFFFEK
ncbi:septum formation initiator family protein [Candidatus Peregrinibacteria bacterium]|nr:septum formation initiator family protein [Candidatus Peregrinibacteria bacterium]